MSWLASFEVLPSPNHVLAKLAIFRGAEPSPHSPRATDSASVFHYYFKPFALFHPVMPPLVHRFISPVFLTTSAPRQPPLPYRFLSSLAHLTALSLSLSPSPLSTLLHSRSRASRLPRTVHLLSSSSSFSSSSLPRVSCLQAEMKISRLLAIETELLFHEVVDPLRPPFLSFKLSLSPLPLELRTPKVLTGHSFFHSRSFVLSIHLAKIKKNQKILYLAPRSIAEDDAKSSPRRIIVRRFGQIVINT